MNPIQPDYNGGPIAFAPPYVDNDGNVYRSMDRLVNACCRYFYSKKGRDGSVRVPRNDLKLVFTKDITPPPENLEHLD